MLKSDTVDLFRVEFTWLLYFGVSGIDVGSTGEVISQNLGEQFWSLKFYVSMNCSSPRVDQWKRFFASSWAAPQLHFHAESRYSWSAMRINADGVWPWRLASRSNANLSYPQIKAAVQPCYQSELSQLPPWLNESRDFFNDSIILNTKKIHSNLTGAPQRNPKLLMQPELKTNRTTKICVDRMRQ